MLAAAELQLLDGDALQSRTVAVDVVDEADAMPALIMKIMMMMTVMMIVVMMVQPINSDITVVLGNSPTFAGVTIHLSTR